MVKWSLTVLLFAFAVLPAQAEVIGIGLDWRKNIFVQEFERDGVPFYAIANLGTDNATISVLDRKGNNLLAGPWVVIAGKTVTLDVSNLVGKGMLAFKLADGIPLGLLDAPLAPEKGAKGIISRAGLNGSGGRSNDVWIEQPTDAVKADADFEVTLVVPKNAGTIKFSKKGEMNNAIRQLPILDAKSDTLPIATQGDTLVIDAGKATKDAPSHRVTLRFHTPAAGSPMTMISGWRMLPTGGGHGITRGIVIAPPAK